MLAHHNFWIYILSNFYLPEFSLSRESVCIQPVHKHLIITNTRVYILRSMYVSIHQTREEKLAKYGENKL